MLSLTIYTLASSLPKILKDGYLTSSPSKAYQANLRVKVLGLPHLTQKTLTVGLSDDVLWACWWSDQPMTTISFYWFGKLAEICTTFIFSSCEVIDCLLVSRSY